MKIAIVGDVHLGKAQKGLAEREEDIYDLFSRICNHLIEKKVDVVCFLGDLFDSSHPPVKSISIALEVFENFVNRNIRVILIAGNHDIPSIKTRMCPVELTKLDESIVELSAKNPIYKFKADKFNINVCGVEYHPPEKRQSLIKALERMSSSILLNECSEKNLNILLLHQGMKEFSPEEEEISLTDIPNIFHFIFVGHLHLRMEKNFDGRKVILPGSIEIGSVSEVVKQMHNEAQVILIDTEKEIDYEKLYIPLSRKFIHPQKFNSSAIDYELKNLSDYLKEDVNNKKPWVYLEIDDDAKIGNALINEKISRATEGKVLFVQPRINTEEINKREEHKEISFKEIDIKAIIKEYFPRYNEEIYELYEKRKDTENAKEIMNKIYSKFKENYSRQSITIDYAKLVVKYK